MLIFPPFSAAAILIAILFASPPSPPPASEQGPLAPAIEARDRAAELALEGKHEDAVMYYGDAIRFGRRAITTRLKEAEEKGDAENDRDDDDGPIRLLVSIYRSSALNRLAVPDLDGARTEAWAACVHAQSLVAAPVASGDGVDSAAVVMEVSAQMVLAAVCRAGDDPFGECQAWRRVLELTGKDGRNDRWDLLPGADDIEGDKELPRSREAVERRFQDVQDELKRKFSNSQ